MMNFSRKKRIQNCRFSSDSPDDLKPMIFLGNSLLNLNGDDPF